MKPQISKEEGQGYVWTQKGREVPGRFDSKLAVEAWRKRDPFLLDMVGFQKFLQYWMQYVNEQGIVPNDEDFIPPCVQCAKGVSCQRIYVHRIGGEHLPKGGFTPSKLVCERIVYRK